MRDFPYYGFNFQWITSWQAGRAPQPADLKALDFLAKHGFNFARIAADYRFWTTDFQYLQPDPAILDVLRSYHEACRQRGIHLSFNMHRVPGYCINSPHIEKHNLWVDQEAQDGLSYQWRWFAENLKDIAAKELSFDLINEPPDIGQYGMTRDGHEALIRRVVAGIRDADSGRPIVIDGLEGGHVAMPEVADLEVVHATRGYQPMPVSHQGASWWDGWRGHEALYPGGDWWGHPWDLDALRDFYQPWRDVQAKGRPIHIGEYGCYNQTPNDVALRWLADLYMLWREFGWGWAMWNFEGAFGIVGHGREGARLEEVDGYLVDRDLLELTKP